MKTAEIRQLFLDYFHSHGHEVVRSSPLVPQNDPTLLFTNAGMVQFKDTFLGLEKRNYQRAVTVQRCVRAGGKHNDLDNVGYTARHHTFFEMMGNFSFGDYFKREAIHHAWCLLTQNIGLAPEKLWVTVYADDDEAAAIWLDDVGIDPQHFARIDGDDNFWSMGDTGPCGPCSEIFYDHGPAVAGGPPGTAEEDGDRYIEIWNLVFMQYNRDTNGQLHPLPRPSVDTGMGLERLAAVLQGVHSNYDIDLFQHLIQAAAELLDVQDPDSQSLRVIADHIRSTAFLITDGVMPGNEGRGYVLRRIIRRAVRHGYMLGGCMPFFYRLVPALVQEMAAAYPELQEAAPLVEKVLKQEELKFAETLDQGIGILQQEMARVRGDTLPGTVAFKLYDTYGFPLDLTMDMARECQIKVDTTGFDDLMAQQRARARAAGRFSSVKKQYLEASQPSQFVGYETTCTTGLVLAVQQAGQAVTRLEAGQDGLLALDVTAFYAESGGQIADRGQISTADAVFEVTDVQKLPGGVYGHYGTLLSGVLPAGAEVQVAVEASARAATARNHSATHLLHAALKQVLGTHVQQKGSLVGPNRLRFDFSHFQAPEVMQLRQVEDLVNAEIVADHEVATQLMNLEEAKASGAMALFGEKYDDQVRVVSMGAFSRELCAGTHVARTGAIGSVFIIAESGIAAGVRRIEAVTGKAAVQYVQQQRELLQQLGSALKVTLSDLPGRTQQLLTRQRQLELQLKQLQQQQTREDGMGLAAQVRVIDGIQVVAQPVLDPDPEVMRQTIDQLKDKLGSVVVVLAGVKDGKVMLIAGVSQDLAERLPAGKLVATLAAVVGGRGGGRPGMAQGGGPQVSKLQDALAAVEPWIHKRLAGTV